MCSLGAVDVQDANFVKNSIKNYLVIAPDLTLKCLSGQLLLQFQSDSLYTWQKYPFGDVDVQDANSVKNSIKNY